MPESILTPRLSGILLWIAVLGLATPLAAAAQTNVAPGGIATQSSPFGAPSISEMAARAIDGNTDGWFSNGSVTHTSGEPSDPYPWWELDLGRNHEIDEVVLWNRTDCCAERIDGYTVDIDSDFNGNRIDSFSSTRIAPVTGNPIIVPTGPPAIVGRWVRIRLGERPGSPPPRILSLAEVQVFGVPVPEPPEPPPSDGPLPLARTLPLDGSWKQGMKTQWDGPKKRVQKVIELAREAGEKLKKVPYDCSWQIGGDDQGSVRFIEVVGSRRNRFEMRDGYGNLVTGTYKRKGDDGEKVEMKIDSDSEKSLKRMLDISAGQCIQVDALGSGSDKFIASKVDFKKAVFKGKIIEEFDRIEIKGKIQGTVEWDRKITGVGKVFGSGKTTHKFTFWSSLSEPPVPPEKCRDDLLLDQGPYIYPGENAQFAGWIEMTEIEGSDNYYLILAEDFISILEDFDEIFDSLQTLLAWVEEDGIPCGSDASPDGRLIVAMELTPFAKTSLLFVFGAFEELEALVRARIEAVFQRAVDEAWDFVKDQIQKQVRKLVKKIVGKIVARIAKAVLKP